MAFRQIGDTRPMMRIAMILSLLLGACALPPPTPEQAACQARMQSYAADLQPAFAGLGYRPQVDLRLDEEMLDGRGFAKPDSILGDASPGGVVRLRPSRLCADGALARAVVAHEMAHVALQHRAVPGSGVTLSWVPQPLEVAANELAYAALVRAGGDPRAARLIHCWLGNCAPAERPDSGRGR